MINNNRLGSTVIYDGNEVFYDVGTRLKGSMFSRQNSSSTGYNVRFGSDQLFRGVHDTVRFDQNGENEILVKYAAAAAGNLGGSYDDVMRLTTPTGQGGGPTLTFLAAHDDLFLSEQFENGADGTLFKMEGIRVMTSTVDRNDPESLKLFQPIGWVSNFDIADLGSDKETYRWPFLIHNNRDRDDYTRLIELAQAFSLSGEALDEALLEIMDVDQWMSTFALMSLFGIGDAYSQGNPHNLNLYVRPSDNKVLAMPWDWDFVFSQSPTAPLHGSKNIGRVINRPEFERIFQGHLNHLIKTVFNQQHMAHWNDHFGDMLGQSFRGLLGRYGQRGSFVLNRLPEEILFGIGTDGGNLETTEFVHGTSSASVLVPTTDNGGDQLGITWTEVDFNPSADWIDGSNGIGFESSPDDFVDLIQLDVGQMQGVNSTVYVRMPFEMDTDASEIDRLKLRMKYDDGFAAYLNGIKVAEANAPSPLAWDSSATASHRDSDAVEFVTVDITDHISTLRPGQNVLAIHGMNRSATGGDLLFVAEMVGQSIIERPPEELMVDTDSVQLSGRGWVDVRHIRVAGESDPLKVTWPETTTWEANIPLQAGRNELALEAVDLAGNVIGTARINVTSEAERPLLEHLRISEIMYHPVAPSSAEQDAGFDDDDDFEFIELINTSSTLSLPLDAVQITGGVQFQFPAVTLQPGERSVVVRNQDAFQLRYGDQVPVAGQYQGRLSNSGEDIQLQDAAGATIVRLDYADSDPWPARADGIGGSVELVDPLATPVDEMSRSDRWRGSVAYGGSPGSAGTDAVGIVINEFLANSDAPNVDTIELWNPTAQAIDVSGWYVSDSGDDLLNYQIPAGTSIAANQYLIIDESDFNPNPLNPGPNDFSLSGTRGDDIWVVIPDQAGGIEQFVDDVHFGATRSGESMGRVSRTSPRLANLTSLTFGASNSAPRVGPVVLSELHVHPAAPIAEALALDRFVTSNDLEFVEVVNTGTEDVDLSAWQLDGGIDYEFDNGISLAPGESLLVLSFNPDSAANVDRLAAFRAHHDLDENGPRLAGGYGGQLNNGGELIQLLRADRVSDVDPEEVSLLLEDEVAYSVRSPWPTGIGGSGQSLHRATAADWGNSPSSWRASAATPGSAAFVNSDLNGDGQTDVQDVDFLCSGIQAGDQQFDLNGDGTIGLGDLTLMIETLIGTDFGDSNLDGVFDSGDLVLILQAGEYEDDVHDNSTWADGDWNCDGDFDTSDLVQAFLTGGFIRAANALATSPERLGAALQQPPSFAAHDHVMNLQAANHNQQQPPARPTTLDTRARDLIFDEVGQASPLPEKLQDLELGDLNRELKEWL